MFKTGLANDGLYDNALGLNSLRHSITVTPSSSQPSPVSSNPVTCSRLRPASPILACPATLYESLDLLSSDANPPNPSLGTMYYAVVSHSSPSAANGILCARVEIENSDEGW